LQANSFEQLCINTANEQLQHFINEHIFAWETSELQEEGIDASHVECVRPISHRRIHSVLEVMYDRKDSLFYSTSLRPEL